MTLEAVSFRAMSNRLLVACLALAIVISSAAAPIPKRLLRGTIVMELYPAKAPKTVAQILRLINSGFYNGQRIHRVEDWVIQWGDPQSKKPNWKQLRVGTQGSGKNLPFESNDIKMGPGVVAMASTGAMVGGDSQIFILTNASKPNAPSLQGNYAAFGKVVSGMNVIPKIRQGDLIRMSRIGSKGRGKNAVVRVQMAVSAG